jgi:acyl carrier protein
MKSINSLIRGVIAHHAGRAVVDIRAWNNLEHDLDLRSLDLVLLALDIEKAIGIDLSAHEIASLETVGDIFSFVARAVAGDDVELAG